jgi:hypothetical protein
MIFSVFLQTVTRFAPLHRSIFSLNTKKRITRKRSQTLSQQRNTRKCYGCPLELEDIMTNYTMDFCLALKTTQYILNWAHTYCQNVTCFALMTPCDTRSPIRTQICGNIYLHSFCHHYTLNIHLNKCKLHLNHAPIQSLLVVSHQLQAKCNGVPHSRPIQFYKLCHTSSCKLLWQANITNGRYRDWLYEIPHAQLMHILECLNRSLGFAVRLQIVSSAKTQQLIS